MFFNSKSIRYEYMHIYLQYIKTLPYCQMKVFHLKLNIIENAFCMTPNTHYYFIKNYSVMFRIVNNEKKPICLRKITSISRIACGN